MLMSANIKKEANKMQSQPLQAELQVEQTKNKFYQKVHCPQENEKQLLSVLFNSSDLVPDWQEATVGKQSLCRWKSIRPSAAYIIPQTPSTKTKRKKTMPRFQANQSRHATFKDSMNSKPLKYSYMSGYLDEDYTYECRQGLSSGVTGDSTVVQSCNPVAIHSWSTIELEPALPFKCPEPSTQSDISRIVSMQLKPEILVEQLLIENRLRAMSMGALPTLNLEGVSLNSDKPATKKTDSAPLLRKSKYHTKRRKRKPLEWCNLNESPPLGRLHEDLLKERLRHVQTQPGDDFPFNNFSYTHQGKSNAPNYRHTLNPNKAELVKDGSCERSTQPTAHVVEPILDTKTPKNGHQMESPSTLTSLLRLWKNTPVRKLGVDYLPNRGYIIVPHVVYACAICRIIDPFGDYQVGCGGNSDCISHHNAIRDVVFTAAQAAALGPSRGASGLIPDSLSHSADVLLPNWSNGDLLPLFSLSPCLKLPILVDTHYSSLVAETLGGLTQDFVSTIRAIGYSLKLRAGSDHDADIAKHLFGRVSIALWRGNARMLIHTSPYVPPDLDGHS